MPNVSPNPTADPARRPLKSRQTRWATALAAWLARRNVSPNAISLGSIAFAAIAAAAYVGCLYTAAPRLISALLVIACVGIQLRLLCNLLDNAERHAASRIVVSVRVEGVSVIMEIADDGAGIPAEHRDMVFDRFTRLDAARDRGAGGTGLGLAIAREIAEAHEGALTIEGSERGACFVLRLPAYDACPSVRTG